MYIYIYIYIYNIILVRVITAVSKTMCKLYVRS